MAAEAVAIQLESAGTGQQPGQPVPRLGPIPCSRHKSLDFLVILVKVAADKATAVRLWAQNICYPFVCWVQIRCSMYDMTCRDCKQVVYGHMALADYASSMLRHGTTVKRGWKS